MNLKKLSILISLIGLFLFIINYPVKNEKNIKKITSLTFDKYPLISLKKEEKEEKLLTLSIPKINLNQNVYGINSKLNNVKYHVTILKESTLPGDSPYRIFLAAHSGKGKIAYFNDLKKLKIGDVAKINYQNQNYTYVVKDINIIKKEPLVSFKKISVNTLTLITCYGHEQRLILNLEEQSNN